MGWAFSVFGWAYAFFEIPGGWLGDRHGRAPRPDAHRDLVVVLHGGHRAGSGTSRRCIVTRTLFGAGEAGAYPNMTRMFTTWLPHRERERAQADPVAVLALGRRVHAAAGRLHPAVHVLAPRLRAVRRPRRDLGGGVLPMVPRRSRPTHPSVNSAELAMMPPTARAAAVAGAISRGALLRIEACRLAALRAVLRASATAGGST